MKKFLLLSTVAFFIGGCTKSSDKLPEDKTKETVYLKVESIDKDGGIIASKIVMLK